MKIFFLTTFFLVFASFSACAEITEIDTDSLSVYGSACEDIKADIQNASTRMKATDKACFNAVSSLPEIVDIKSSFDEHDYNVMIYTIVDEYIEDLNTKTTKQDDEQLCVEVTGYISPENIGKAIDQTIHQKPDENPEETTLPEPVVQNPEEPNPTVLTGEAEENTPFVILTTIYVKPTEFYNNTVSSSHSNVLKNILAQNDSIHLVDNEQEANFIITPKVLKAKIEPLNSETSRLQMVVAIETFDKNQNNIISEHQNKLVMFNNADDEQEIAKNLLKKLFEQCSQSIFNITSKSNKRVLQQQNNDLSQTEAIIPASTGFEEAGVQQAE